MIIGSACVEPPPSLEKSQLRVLRRRMLNVGVLAPSKGKSSMPEMTYRAPRDSPAHRSGPISEKRIGFALSGQRRVLASGTERSAGFT
jgi:hypothetical protein